MNNSTTILLAGATGRVGEQIARTVLDCGAQLRMLVRPASFGDKILEPLVRRGVSIIKGNVMDSDSLKFAVEEIDVVISALRGGREIIVDGQLALAEKAKEAGARRIIPSGFSSELFNFDKTDANVVNNIILRIRREAAEAIAATGLPATHLMNGTFMGSMMDSPPLSPFVLEEGVFEYWGDGEHPAAYTTLGNGVEYAVKAALDPDPPARLRVAGDVLTMKEMKNTYEQVTGRKLSERRLGSVNDLQEKIARLKTKAASPMDYVFHQFRYSIASGAGNLDPLNNARYPSVNKTTFKDFVKDRVA